MAIGRSPLAAPALLCLAGCGAAAPPELPGDIEWRSEHFVYHARARDPEVCPEVLERMERHFEVIHAAAGLAWPEGRVIHYSKFVDQDDYEAAAGCPSDTNGCARDGAAYAYAPFHEHELIHTYFEPLGAPPRILTEGVAELFSCDAFEFLILAFVQSEPNDAELVGSHEIEFHDPERHVPYVMGPHVVSHLVKTYGWETFVELYGAAWEPGDTGQLDRELRERYGTTWDDVWDAAARVADGTACVAAWACAADPLQPGRAETPHESCDDSSFRSVTPTQTEVLQLDAEFPGVALLECPSDPGEPVSAYFAAAQARTFAALEAGSYSVVNAGDATLTSRRLDDSMFGSACSALAPLAFEVPDTGASWHFQPRPSPYFLRLELPAGTQLSVGVEGTGPVQLCPSCATDGCVSIEGFGKFSAASSVVLQFPAVPQPGRWGRLSLWPEAGAGSPGLGY